MVSGGSMAVGGLTIGRGKGIMIVINKIAGKSCGVATCWANGVVRGLMSFRIT
jgi:hypothetical protein